MEKIVYKEEQRYSQLWLWLLLAVSFGVPIIILIDQMVVEAKAGSKEVILLGFVLFFILVVGGVFFVLFLKMKLVVEISTAELKFRYPPLSPKWKFIKKDEIENFEVRRYRPVVEYGGWGIKTNWKKRNIAYNVKGNIGLQLYLKNGNKILFWTQRKQAINYAMEKLMNSERED